MRKFIILLAVITLTMPLAYQASADSHMEGEEQEYNQQNDDYRYDMRRRGYAPGDGRYHMGPGMRGYGPGMRGYGQGMMNGGEQWHNWSGQRDQQADNLTKQDAKAIVKNFVDSNYKGYTVLDDIISFDRPRGKVFQLRAEDESGNKFVFMVNPWGQVRGPILVK